MTRIRTLACLAAILVGPAPAAAAEPLDVVASFSILGDMAARVAGDRAVVTTLVGPNGDAHVYQPTPADARRVAEADLVVVNGLGFEGFLDRLLEASGYAGPVVVASKAAQPLAVDDHADGDEHDHGPSDPHAWQDLANGMAYVSAIEDGLCAAARADCPAFRANGKAYRAELAALDREIRDRVAAVPAERRRVITSHDAFGYFGRAYGITFLAPQGVSTESEASARDVAALIEQIRATGVKVLFVESIADPRLIEQIASETGATVGGDLQSDALAPAGEPGSSYLGMMRANADALISAMERGS